MDSGWWMMGWTAWSGWRSMLMLITRSGDGRLAVDGTAQVRSVCVCVRWKMSGEMRGRDVKRESTQTRIEMRWYLNMSNEKGQGNLRNKVAAQMAVRNLVVSFSIASCWVLDEPRQFKFRLKSLWTPFNERTSSSTHRSACALLWGATTLKHPIFSKR